MNLKVLNELEVYFGKKNDGVDPNSNDLAKIESSLSESEGVTIVLPPILKSFYELHDGMFQTQSPYFYCILFSSKQMFDTTKDFSIFGDEDIRKEWREDFEQKMPNGESVASPGWCVLGSESEYDYLFVCLNKESHCYGEVRSMTNNCWEERRFTEGPMEKFFDELLLMMKITNGYCHGSAIQPELLERKPFQGEEEEEEEDISGVTTRYWMSTKSSLLNG